MSTLEVKTNEKGELFIEFPEKLLNQMGWDEGTLLDWMIDEEEKIILKEAEHGGKGET